ncbi:MAG: putative collagen-binding domain-containing protein [Bacteroidota bacterium]
MATQSNLTWKVFESPTAQAWWYHAATGICVDGGKMDVAPAVSFDPPGDESRGNDWALLIEA